MYKTEQKKFTDATLILYSPVNAVQYNTQLQAPVTLHDSSTYQYQYICTLHTTTKYFEVLFFKFSPTDI